ncbi:B-box zinc finger protein 20 [Dichanthelium oligosanthes]|uniref:B-box zinc finger protein 20 n=1 Tax=Dichanthelium oligosanthes TaxID=888268 RepID=A0A1E5VLE4_9POAL|nr:B-box zinc finger protein 20 [Dichanthelium oligosanthes]
MLVRCDVCGAEPAAVLCCADEAALCNACDRRVHRANKLADKHRRIPLLHPSGDDSATAAPLCDVCKERRGLVFCVEDRAILCADCDEPIHSANDLTAKHSRFLLIGAKLSAALVDQALPSPDDCRGRGSEEPHDDVAAICAQAHQDSCRAKSPVPDGSNSCVGGGCSSGSSISDYLTNICPGWRVDDLLFDDAAFSTATKASGCDEHEQVPSLDADLFDVVAGRPGKRGAWYGGALGIDKVPAAASIAVPTAAKQQGRVRERQWDFDSDSDAFAVPEISQQPRAKMARPEAPSFWCF